MTDVYRWRHAPGHLLTRRQLRARGLRPAGQEPVAEIRWRRGERVAYLYDVELARPVRPMTPGRVRALAAAMLARRTCPLCATDCGYCISLTHGACWACVSAELRDQEYDDAHEDADTSAQDTSPWTCAPSPGSIPADAWSWS